MPEPKDWTEAYGVFVKRLDGGKPSAAKLVLSELLFFESDATSLCRIRNSKTSSKHEVRRVFVSVGDVVE